MIFVHVFFSAHLHFMDKGYKKTNVYHNLLDF